MVRKSEFARGLIEAGFVKPGGGVYIAAFVRFIGALAPNHPAVDRHTVTRWLRGEDNAVAAALVRVIQIPRADVKRMIHESCKWGGKRKRSCKKC